MLTRRFTVALILFGLMLGTGPLRGQTYPAKPIRIITGGVGGANDFTARLIAQGISGPLGQPVVIENRGGSFASGEAAAKAPPDGYVLLVAGGTLWNGPVLRKTPYDPVADFTPITNVGIEPNLLVVHPSVPANSVRELITLARSHPGQLNYSFGSIGGGGHIAAELFKSMAGIRVTGVPYKTDSQEIGDLLGGYVQLTFNSGVKVGTHIKAGKLRALGVGSLQPSTLAPGVPTIAAAGLPGYESVSMTGVFAPGKTPPTIINRLNQEIVRFLKTGEAREKLLTNGVEVIASSPEELAAKVKAEMIATAKVAKEAGIRVE